MYSIAQNYKHLNHWAMNLSRSKYAILTGFSAAFGVLAVSVALGEPDYAFAIGISLTLATLNYWSNPNQNEE